MIQSSLNEMRTRREGFPDQTLINLPQTIVREASNEPLLRGLSIAATGFFPNASGHLVERSKPIPEHILIYCVEGQGWVEIGTRKRETVATKTLALLPAAEAHRYGADKEKPWTIHWVHLRGDEAPHFATLLGLSPSSPLLLLHAQLSQEIDFTPIHQTLSQDYTLPSQLFAATQLRQIFVALHQGQGKETTPLTIDPIEKSLQWMRDHLSERATLPQLAQRSGLSVAQYSNRFRGKTGYSPIDFFLRLKVQHACRLLDTTSHRIEEIATVLGYDDPFYFSRLFRRIMSTSPRDYRASQKG